MPLLFDYAPPWFWALGCVAIAAFYVWRWPRHKAGGATSGFRYLVLRWFHALVWALLALSVGLHIFDSEAARGIARGLAVLALVLYGTFVIVLLLPRPKPRD